MSEEMYGSENALQNLFLGTIGSGIGTVFEVGKLGVDYAADPRNRERINSNAKRFTRDFGKYTPSFRDNPLADLNTQRANNSDRNQQKQLEDARLVRDPTNGRWNNRNETGFDDERDNSVDDRARRQSLQASYNNKNTGNDMSDDSDSSRNRNSKTIINSSRPSDYDRGEKLLSDYRKQDLDSQGSIYNYTLQDASRRYNTDKTTDTTYKLGTQKNRNDYAVGTQKNEVDYAVGMNRNEVTRDVGKYASNNQLKASNFKSQLQSGDARNETDVKYKSQSGDNRYDTTTKYQTQKDINKYQWDNVNQTSLAESQVKAGTYGMSKDAQSKAANDKTNFDSWKRQNDANHDYTDRQNAQRKLAVDMAQTERAYNDQQRDKDNDRMAASARWQHETAVKAADRSQFYADQKVQRDQQRADFGLRSQQIQAQINAADRDYGLKASESVARVNQINTDVSLKSQQFAAARGDIGYNRTRQRRSLAF